MQIRFIQEKDKQAVKNMMEVFYSSPAVLSNGSEEIFCADINACLSDNPYLEGYVFEENHEIVGYGMVAKSFSTEFGKPCMWIEDIYVLPSYRGKGIGSKFLEFISCKYPNTILRLEVEEENFNAVKTYKKNGFEVLPYMQMKKEIK